MCLLQLYGGLLLDVKKYHQFCHTVKCGALFMYVACTLINEDSFRLQRRYTHSNICSHAVGGYHPCIHRGLSSDRVLTDRPTGPRKPERHDGSSLRRCYIEIHNLIRFPVFCFWCASDTFKHLAPYFLVRAFV